MIPREIEKKFKKVTEMRKITLLTGARQVGKSTFIKDRMKKRSYVTLDDLSLRALAISDPKLFLLNNPAPLIIDEAQYAPNLFPYLKAIVDESPEKNRYWLTGSQRFELMKQASESLAGRVGILELSSLSLAEKRGFSSKVFDPEKIRNSHPLTPTEIFQEIFRGGMPELIVENYDKDPFARNQFFNDYVATFLERDVRNLTQVGDLASFRRFLVSVAARNGEVLNYASICDDAGIDAKTAKHWISILEASDIIYLLKPYFSSALKRTTKSPKIIFLDTGLCAFLCNWNSPESLESSSTSGHYLETFVISELIKNRRNSDQSLNYEIYFYRDRDGKEIDLIIEMDGNLYGFEIKKTASPTEKMLANFEVFETANIPIKSGGLLCFYPQTLPLTEKYKSYPLTVIF